MNSGNSKQASEPSVEDVDFHSKLRFYLLATVIAPGLLFNLLSFAVFLQARLRKSPTIHYFLALAFADNIVLSGELLSWLNSFTSEGQVLGLSFMHENSVICRFVYGLRYFGRFFSSWLVVTICVERFLAVAYPFKIASWSTTRKTQLIIIMLSVVCFVLACPGFLTVGKTMRSDIPLCDVHIEHENVYRRWIVYVKTPLESVIPAILVTIFTALIIYKIIKAHQQQALTREGQSNQSQTQSGKQPTLALLAVAVAFVMLRTPYILVYTSDLIKNGFVTSVETWEHLRHIMTRDITYFLEVLNYAINFFLYIVTGTMFRREFKRFFLCEQFRRRSLHFATHSSSLPSRPVRCINEQPRIQDSSSRDPTYPSGEYVPVCQDSKL